jgi:hypothetical protein
MAGRDAETEPTKRVPYVPTNVELYARLLDAASYAFNAYALPQLIAGVATSLLGFAVCVRERGSRVGALYLFQTLAIGTWLIGFGVAYSTLYADVAERWLRLGHLGVCFIPALTLQFTWGVVHPARRIHWLLWLGWLASSSFAVLTIVAPSVILATPHHYAWGYYPHYTLFGALILPFYGAWFGYSLMLYWGAYRRAHRSSVAARRARLLYVAFAVGGIAAVDFLPTFGIDVRPFGYAPILVGIALVTYVTKRHRLVDITPAFAANQILDTIDDGLCVLDKDGVVQVANEPLLLMVGDAKH